MSLSSIFQRGRRAAHSSRRVDSMNDHMLRDIGLRRINSAQGGGMYSAAPFSRYSDN